MRSMITSDRAQFLVLAMSNHHRLRVGDESIRGSSGSGIRTQSHARIRKNLHHGMVIVGTARP
jgi:hypothetical protein